MEAQPKSILPEALQGLEPVALWKHFYDLTQIPRESNNEAAAIAHMIEWANRNGFVCKQDEAGNLCVKVPGSSGYEDAPAVCLQGHIDMVCTKKEGVDHDFERDPIVVVRDEDKITAEGTSLGADNGIGLAAAMVVADDPNATHPPLELLVTVAEEVGFDGARALDYGALEMTGTTLINLDNEQVGETCVESAGLRISSGFRPVGRESAGEKPTGSFYEFSIGNLPGGHSAKEITRGIPNAIKAMAVLLREFGDSVRLISINGGEKMNSIPMGCKAVIFVPEDKDINFSVEKIQFLTKFGGEVGIRGMAPEEVNCAAMTAETHSAILTALDEVQDGLEKMHEVYSGTAFISSNLGTVRTGDEGVKVEFSVRSPSKEDIARVSDGITRILKGNGFEVEDLIEIETWNADPNSDLVAAINQAYRDVTGDEAVLGATHGGLEGGTITSGLSRHLGGAVIQSAAFGPEINKPHSPGEYVLHPTVPVFDAQLRKVLLNLAERSRA